MESVRFSVAVSNSTSRLPIYTFQCSLRDAGLLRCPGLVAAKDYLGTSWGQLEEGGGDLWSCLVGGTVLGPRPAARQVRDRSVAVDNGRRTVRPSTIRLRCCVAWHMAASSAACGLDCVISEHHGRLERHVTKIIADNTFEIFTFNGYRCWRFSVSCHPVRGERVRHAMREARCSFSSETGDNQIALASPREYPLSLGATVHI